MPIQIIVENCTGCRLCIKSCPFSAIQIINKKAVIDLNKCNLCGACLPSCKFKAVLLEKLETAAPNSGVKDYRGIWVFIEQKNGKIQSISYELLGKAQELAKKLNCQVSACLIGNNLDDQLDDLIWHGADNIYLVEAAELTNFQEDPYTNILVKLI